MDSSSDSSKEPWLRFHLPQRHLFRRLFPVMLSTKRRLKMKSKKSWRSLEKEQIDYRLKKNDCDCDDDFFCQILNFFVCLVVNWNLFIYWGLLDSILFLKFKKWKIPFFTWTMIFGLFWKIWKNNYFPIKWQIMDSPHRLSQCRKLSVMRKKNELEAKNQFSFKI